MLDVAHHLLAVRRKLGTSGGALLRLRSSKEIRPSLAVLSVPDRLSMRLDVGVSSRRSAFRRLLIHSAAAVGEPLSRAHSHRELAAQPLSRDCDHTRVPYMYLRINNRNIDIGCAVATARPKPRAATGSSNVAAIHTAFCSFIPDGREIAIRGGVLVIRDDATGVLAFRYSAVSGDRGWEGTPSHHEGLRAVRTVLLSSAKNKACAL